MMNSILNTLGLRVEKDYMGRYTHSVGEIRIYGRKRTILNIHYGHSGFWRVSRLHRILRAVQAPVFGVAVHFGPGAGYIGGRTAFIGIGARTKQCYQQRSLKPRVGITDNSNEVPRY